MNDQKPTADRAGSRIKSPLLLWLAAAVTLALVAVIVGCPDKSSAPSDGATPGQTRAGPIREELFGIAMNSLNTLEQYDDPERLPQAVKRLDQWMQDQEAPADWSLDPLVSTLPGSVAEIPKLLGVDQMEFPGRDGYVFREAVWLREISGWAAGDDIDPLTMAERLFDWTIRNIQLEWDAVAGEDGAVQRRVLQHPWETLAFGKGTATERSWVFVRLLRQVGLDAAMLTAVWTDEAGERQSNPWVIGVLIDGSIYLFDPALGLPLPAPDGLQKDETGQLTVRPATLTQVLADGELLRQFDIEGFAYPFHREQLDSIDVLLEATPIDLSLRMALVESRLVGDMKLVLTANPTAQAERFKASPHVADVRLWTLPYEQIIQEGQLGQMRQQWLYGQLLPFQVGFGTTPVMWKARVKHLKGELTGQYSATYFYGSARRPEREIQAIDSDPQVQALYHLAKLNASYWLGLITAHQGNHRAAIDYFEKRTLEFLPNGPWTPGAKYNLARVYEAEQDFDRAVAIYQSAVGMPSTRGNLLRVQFLASAGLVSLPPPVETDEEEAADADEAEKAEDIDDKAEEAEKTEESQAS